MPITLLQNNQAFWLSKLIKVAATAKGQWPIILFLWYQRETNSVWNINMVNLIKFCYSIKGFIKWLKKICFFDWSKPYIALFDQTLWSPCNLAREVDNYCIITVKYQNIDWENPYDVRFKSNVLIGWCIFINQSLVYYRVQVI